MTTKQAPSPPSIAAAIEELERNLEINQGRFKFAPYRSMRLGQMHEQRMVRAIELLKWLKRNEKLIKQRLAE